jgi:peptide alpha-N-acetyltransferase
LDSSLASLPPKVQEVVKSEFIAISDSTDLRKYNAEFRQKHKSSPKHALQAVRTARLLGEDRGTCEKELVDLLQIREISLIDAGAILETLKDWRSPQVKPFKEAATKKWPEATVFA